MGATKRLDQQTALLLTGYPGVGKTTIVQKVVHVMPIGTVRGFYTDEIREGRMRRGFRLTPFGGRPRVLAHVEHSSQHRVGKYGVDVAVVDEVVDSWLRPDPAVRLYMIDEIGKMECLSRKFVAGVRSLLNSRIPVVATVALRGSGFIDEVKRLPSARVWEVTAANGDSLPASVLEWVESQLASRGMELTVQRFGDED